MGISDISDENFYSSPNESTWRAKDGKQEEKCDVQKEKEDIEEKSPTKYTPGQFGNLNKRNLMKYYNKLCDIVTYLKKDGHKVDMELSQIVVCGAQSSGKTSLLETVAKINFLPKGADIQTRCPIEIQLRRSTNGQTWVQFLDNPDEIFTDMEKVKKKIQKVNEEIMEETFSEIDADGNMIVKKRVVSDIPITLKLFSPDVPNLTLVDLPGFCPCPKDSQPKDLKTQIENVVLKYISRPNSIILAVVPASQELETNSTTEFVELADPKRERTVLVITKLDTVDANNTILNVKSTLEGKNKVYRLGIVGVVNRQANVAPDIALETERIILERCFPTIADKHGIPYFTKRISELLIANIIESLPSVKIIIKEKIGKLKECIKELGDEDTGEHFYKHLNAFSETFRSQINGAKKGLKRSTYPLSKRVHEIFDETFFPAVDSFKPCENLFDEDIDYSLAWSRGVQGYMQLSSQDWTDALHSLIGIEIMGLQKILLKCAEQVYTEMNKAVEPSHDKDVKMRHKIFAGKTSAVMSAFINESFEDCKKHLAVFIESESIGYTTDLYFYKKMGEQMKHSKMEGQAKNVDVDDDAKTEQESVDDQGNYNAETESDWIPVKNKTKKGKRQGYKTASKQREFATDIVGNSLKKSMKKRKQKDSHYDHNAPKTVVGSATDAISEGVSQIPIFGAAASFLVKTAGDGLDKLVAGDDDAQADSEQGKKNVFQKIRQQIQLYFVQVKWSVKNYVPKAILNTLVYGVERRMVDELTNRTLEGDSIKNLMRLSEEMETEKEKHGKTLSWYQEADDIITMMERAVMN